MLLVLLLGCLTAFAEGVELRQGIFMNFNFPIKVCIQLKYFYCRTCLFQLSKVVDLGAFYLRLGNIFPFVKVIYILIDKTVDEDPLVAAEAVLSQMLGTLEKE